MPTASGKTPVIAQICKDTVLKWKGRVIVLAHVKELLQQSVNKLDAVAPELFGRIGVYSAGLKSRDTQQAVIVAGIQSVYKRACELGKFDIIIIDESHLIPEDGEGRYLKFLKDMKIVNPKVRVVGLTATPYRMSTGKICKPGNILNKVCYEIGIKELIDEGFLCPLISKEGREKVDASKLHMRAGEFMQDEVEKLMDTNKLVKAAVKDIVEKTKNRHSVLIFCSGIKHALHVQEELQKRVSGEVCCVFGETLPGIRAETLEDFKQQGFKYLLNINVLSTGFDAECIDCVVLLKITASPGHYYQMVGRSFRIHPSKVDSLILDFGGNIWRHGPVDKIVIKEKGKGTGGEVIKKCPACESLVSAGFLVCPHCGHEFPPPKKQDIEEKASEDAVLSVEFNNEELEVQDVFYFEHTKRDAEEGDPTTLRIEYRIGLNYSFSEWICFDHSGWARQKAESWWRTRSDAPIPASVKEAVQMARSGYLCNTEGIMVRLSEKSSQFPKIIGYALGEKPEFNGDTMLADINEEEIPF